MEEALAPQISQGAIHIMRLYPSLGERVVRFAAYLEVARFPKRDYKVLNSVWTHCNGK
jgi:hypothetical protein